MWRSGNHLLGRKQRRLRELSRKSWGAWALLAGLLLLVWGGAAGYGYWSFRKLTASDHLPEIALQANNDLVYDLSKLEPGQSRFFTYPTSSSDRSKVLVNRDSDGIVRAAFATCTTCYSFRGQHHLKEGQFMCGQCQTAMRIGDRNERMTADKSCVAVPVPFSVESNKVVVRAQAITQGTIALAEAARKGANRAGASSSPQAARP